MVSDGRRVFRVGEHLERVAAHGAEGHVPEADVEVAAALIVVHSDVSTSKAYRRSSPLAPVELPVRHDISRNDIGEGHLGAAHGRSGDLHGLPDEVPARAAALRGVEPSDAEPAPVDLRLVTALVVAHAARPHEKAGGPVRVLGRPPAAGPGLATAITSSASSQAS